MDLIKWGLASATAIAGLSTTPYSWAAVLLDTNNVGPLFQNPQSKDSYRYLSEHSIASHLSLASSRSGINYMNEIILTPSTQVRRHRGSYIEDISSELIVMPSRVFWEGAEPSLSNCFQSAFLTSTKRIYPIIFTQSFILASLVQEFDAPTFVQKVIYATSSDATNAQRPNTIEVLYKDTNGIWQQGPDQFITANPLDLKYLSLDVTCTAVRLQIKTQVSGQTGWSVDTFVCVTNVENFIEEEPQALLLFPILRNAPSLPQTLLWSDTTTPFMLFEANEFYTNRMDNKTHPFYNLVAFTGPIVLEANTV